MHMAEQFRAGLKGECMWFQPCDVWPGPYKVL